MGCTNMTDQETRKILMMIESIYPTFKVENVDETVEAWHWALSDYPAEAILISLQMYIRNNGTAFAPSVSQLINGIYKPQENQIPSEGEAWSLVKKAIQDGNYHAEERFNELPELVQKAVGSANMIRQWAQTDSEEVNTVIMSNFQRSYRIIVERSKEDARINPLIMGMVNAIEGKQQGLIGG